MRYSKAAASLLSSVFSFRAKSLVAANIFNPTDHEADGVALLAPSDNNADAGILSQDEDLLAIKLKQMCDELNIDCSMLAKKLHGRTAGIDADTGLLAPADKATKNGMDVAPSSWMASTTVSTCDNHGFVDCVNGYVRGSDPARTCFAACEGECCESVWWGTGPYDACKGFTGKVCKDGSCKGGYNACINATIPSVVNSCKGSRACYKAGYLGGSIGKIVDSCVGDLACIGAAAYGGSIGSIVNSCIDIGGGFFTGFACISAASNGGYIGNIDNSCNGNFVCADIGRSNGKVGNLTNSCIGASACINGAKWYGSIGSIMGSCTANQACATLGAHWGKVGSLTNSCNATKSCNQGANYAGVIGNIANSCTADQSCYLLGRGVGKVGHVTDSCTKENSCKKAGSNRGSIGSISASCNADAACNSTGSGSAGAITSNLMGCCNTPSACQSATQTTLPKACSSKAGKIRA